jgi:hypothetical protein
MADDVYLEKFYNTMMTEVERRREFGKRRPKSHLGTEIA